MKFISKFFVWQSSAKFWFFWEKVPGPQGLLNEKYRAKAKRPIPPFGTLRAKGVHRIAVWVWSIEIQCLKLWPGPCLCNFTFVIRNSNVTITHRIPHLRGRIKCHVFTLLSLFHEFTKNFCKLQIFILSSFGGQSVNAFLRVLHVSIHFVYFALCSCKRSDLLTPEKTKRFNGCQASLLAYPFYLFPKRIRFELWPVGLLSVRRRNF